jgi:chromosomal replication initiator protein
MGRFDPQVRDAMLAHLRKNYPSMCRHWFDDIEPLDVLGGTLRLLVRESVQLRYLQRCCVDQFTEAAQVATGRLLAVRFIGEEELTDDGRTVAAPPPPAARSNGDSAHIQPVAADDEMIISPDYSFANFVIGPGNRLAHAAAFAVAQKPGKAYNPLFVHGGVGLGKTHLLQAICQLSMRGNSQMRIFYVSCESFMSHFLESVQAGVMNEFRGGRYSRPVEARSHTGRVLPHL